MAELKERIVNAIHDSYDMTEIENGFVQVYLDGDRMRLHASRYESADADYNVDCRYEATHLDEHLAAQVEDALHHR